jgi:hypothetical protein
METETKLTAGFAEKENRGAVSGEESNWYSGIGGCEVAFNNKELSVGRRYDCCLGRVFVVETTESLV